MRLQPNPYVFFFPPLSELTLFSLETSNNCTGPKDEVKIILKQFAIKTSNCISLLAIQNLIREFCSSLPDEDLLNYTCDKMREIRERPQLWVNFWALAVMIHVGENKERRESGRDGRWRWGLSVSNLSALAGSVKGFVNYPGLICHHMMFARGWC